MEAKQRSADALKEGSGRVAGAVTEAKKRSADVLKEGSARIAGAMTEAKERGADAVKEAEKRLNSAVGNPTSPQGSSPREAVSAHSSGGYASVTAGLAGAVT